MMIGMPDSARTRVQISIPSIPGSMRSSRMRSGLSERQVSTACAPSAQKTVSNPSVRRTMPIISARAVSSSTTRMRDVICRVVLCVGMGARR
jgi:hypothetical protein